MNWFAKGYKESLYQLRKKRRRDFFTALFVWFLVPLLFVASLVFICRSYERSIIDNLKTMQVEKLRLQSEQEVLKQSISDLSSRKRISDYAREELGMKYPESDEIVLVMFEESPQSPEKEPSKSTDNEMTRYSRERGEERSLINVLTHFFALYVF